MNIHNANSSNLSMIIREFGVKAFRREINGDYTLFVPENCDCCGKVCEGANSIGISSKCKLDHSDFVSAGLKHIDTDQELSCNDKGDAVCTNCYYLKGSKE